MTKWKNCRVAGNIDTITNPLFSMPIKINKNTSRFTIFPWRKANAFQLLADEQIFPALVTAIDGAQHYVLVELYLFESGNIATQFIDALLAATARNIPVYLLLDDFGSKGLNQTDRKRLHQHGIELVYFNPLRVKRLRRYLSRDHRKLLVVDGQIAFTGSIGIVSGIDPSHELAMRWRETMVKIQGPIVSDWQILFASAWNRSTTQKLRAPILESTQKTTHMHGRVVASRPMRPAAINSSLVHHAFVANQRVWICTAYFIPTRKLRRVLRRKAKQNVDVRILLPGPITDHPSIRFTGRSYFTRLLKVGVRIFEYQPRFMHAKTVLCDDWVSIGSCNFDRWNLRRNLEANQEIKDPTFAEQVKLMFDEDFNNAQEITYEVWKSRAWYHYVIERFWDSMVRFLEKIK